MKRSSILLLVAAALVGLVVLGLLGPAGQPPSRSIGPSPPERPTDAHVLECRLYVSFGSPGSWSAGRIYRKVTVSGRTDVVVRYGGSDQDGCPSAVMDTLPRDRT